MILKEATIRYKGYDPDDLTPGSNKRICVICDHCDRVRYVKKRDYRNLCISCAGKNRFEDPKEREKQSKTQIKRWEDPLRREKQSKIQIKRWKDQLERKRQSDRQKKHYKDNPTRSESISRSLRKMWEDPDRHIRQSEIHKKLNIEDPTRGQKQSERMIKRFEDPVEREKNAKSIKKGYRNSRWNDQLNNFINGEPITDWINPPSYYYGVYNLPEYKKWRISVFKRDDYICQMCAQRGGELNSHHIYKVSDYPELIFEINNGITLCYDCHFHKVNHHEEEYEIEFLSKIFDNKGIEIFGE